jgi:hypothetical protein
MITKIWSKPNGRELRSSSGLIKSCLTQPVIFPSLTHGEVEVPQNILIVESVSRGFNWGDGGLFFYGELPEDVLGKNFRLNEVYSLGSRDEKFSYDNVNVIHFPNRKPIQVYNKELASKSSLIMMGEQPTGDLLIPDAQCLYVDYGSRVKRFFFSGRTGESWTVAEPKTKPKLHKRSETHPHEPTETHYYGDERILRGGRK